MWEMFKRIKPMLNLPWLMMGDFNKTMWKSEHFSKRKGNDKEILNFKFLS
jgi:hypothetical protein